MTPRRPRSHILSDLSVARLHHIFSTQGWTVEDLDKDYGEDLSVRLFQEGSALPYSFYVQAKATDRIHASRTEEGSYYSVQLKVSHLQYWQDFWEPVIVTLWDSRSDRFYWEIAQSPEREPSSGIKNKLFYMPIDNQLDIEGLERIKMRTMYRHERYARERAGADILIRRLSDLLNVEIDYDPQNGLLIVVMPDGEWECEIFGHYLEK